MIYQVVFLSNFIEKRNTQFDRFDSKAIQRMNTNRNGGNNSNIDWNMS